MKTIMLAGMFFLFLPHRAAACDVCGCGAGGAFGGIMPQFKSHFAGVRFFYRGFQSFHPGSFLDSNAAFHSRDDFYTMDIWGRFTVKKRLQLAFSVPVNHAVQSSPGKKLMGTGLGDVQLQASYLVIDVPDTVMKPWKHILSLGAGIKLPTGNFRQVTDSIAVNPNLQPGSGSWDFWGNVNYTARYRNWGMNLDLAFRKNNLNPDLMQLGDRFTLWNRFFYVKAWEKVALMPSVGYTFEWMNKEVHDGIREPLSGGTIGSISAGLDFYTSWCSLGVHGYMPVHYEINGGSSTAFPRVQTYVVLFF